MYPALVDPRQENHSQSVHLHMHHFCPCLNMVYQYCPPTYRPSIVPYPQSRPYNLHHYQYTQYNMLPYNSPTHATVVPQHVTVPSSPVHGQTHYSEVVFGPRDRRNLERNGEEPIATEKKLSALDHVDFLSTIANAVPHPEPQDPPQEHNASSSTITTTATPVTDTFIKFLEDSCLRAEHIAYRNRNRPCFRNIQNLCIRTRNEILKPCTTISNIHSQGIPWATKDFIYAFIRLINCWHILKGYLEKDGSLGKIEKELTAEFKTCYYKWEKDSMELAEELRRIFCNLDANISNPTTTAGGNGANPNFDVSLNHVPSSAARVQNGSKRPDLSAALGSLLNATSKEPPEAATNRAPSQMAGDSAAHFDSSESSLKEEDSIYMKPGSYSVPRKNESSNESPRSFEFLETAQNTHKRYKDRQESVEKMWQNAQTAAPNLISRMVPAGLEYPVQKAYEEQKDEELLFGTAVQTWVNTGLYPSTADELREKEFHQKNASTSFDCSKPITVLQRSKNGPFEGEKTSETSYFQTENYTLLRNSLKDGYQKQQPMKAAGKGEATTRPSYRKQRVEEKGAKKGDGKGEEGNGFSRDAVLKFREILSEMKTTEFSVHLNHRRQLTKEDEDKESKFPTTLSTISKKFEENTYRNIDEIVHDFRYLTLHAKLLFKDEDGIMTTLAKFVQKFERAISTAFPEIEFNHVTAERNENVISAHQNKKNRNDGDGDH